MRTACRRFVELLGDIPGRGWTQNGAHLQFSVSEATGLDRAMVRGIVGN